jgi:hypothetical protein
VTRLPWSRTRYFFLQKPPGLVLWCTLTSARRLRVLGISVWRNNHETRHIEHLFCSGKTHVDVFSNSDGFPASVRHTWHSGFQSKEWAFYTICFFFIFYLLLLYFFFVSVEVLREKLLKIQASWILLSVYWQTVPTFWRIVATSSAILTNVGKCLAIGKA